jgi:hypothetical protein
MEDDRTTEPDPAPPPPSEAERADAEDTSAQDAPADPVVDPETTTEPETEGEVEKEEEVEAESGENTSDTPASPESVTNELPRTTTTGDDEQDLRSAGDGAVSGPPGDDLDDPSQRHD